MGRVWNAWASAIDRFSSALQPLGRRLDPIINFWMGFIANSLSSDERTYTYDSKEKQFYVSGDVDEEFETEKDIGKFEGVVAMIALLFVLFPAGVYTIAPATIEAAIVGLVLVVFAFAYLGRVQYLWTEEDAFELEVIR